jgi:hypothetical protein
MRQISLKHAPLSGVVVGAFILLWGGGDPPAIRAQGTLSLGTGVDATAFQSLKLRLVPDTGGTYDPAAAFPRDAPASDGPSARTVFPHRYSIQSGVGSVPQSRWRLVAWLAQKPAGDEIGSGDIYGTESFTIPSCGWNGGYCGQKTGLDVVLDMDPGAPALSR